LANDATSFWQTGGMRCDDFAPDALIG